jgi:hypothetical protein
MTTYQIDFIMAKFQMPLGLHGAVFFSRLPRKFDSDEF